MTHGAGDIRDREQGEVFSIPDQRHIQGTGFVYVSVPPTPVKCPLSVQGTHIESEKVSSVFLEMSRHGYLKVKCEENYLGLQSGSQTLGSGLCDSTVSLTQLLQF